MKTIQKGITEGLMDYWHSSAYASFLTFLASKFIGLNQKDLVIYHRQNVKSFIEKFLKDEDGPYLNPCPFNTNQPHRCTAEELVAIIDNHRANSRYDYGPRAFEFISKDGQTYYKFRQDYLGVTQEYALRFSHISLSRVVLWLYRNYEFKDRETLFAIKRRFFQDFHITKEELAMLFNDDNLFKGKSIFAEPSKTPLKISEQEKDELRTDDSDILPNRVVVSRKIRDSKNALKIKALYNYRCQICGKTLKLPNGQRYAEAHHVRPYAGIHNGPDKENNIICVCPNHHALLIEQLLNWAGRDFD